jgi:hypothetical protein
MIIMALKLVVVHADVQFFEQHVVPAYCGGWAVQCLEMAPLTESCALLALGSMCNMFDARMCLQVV